MNSEILASYFKFTGRLDRMRFFTKGIMTAFVYFLGVILSCIFAPLGYPVYFIAAIMALSICARRCHDFGYSGFFSLIFLIPYVNTFFVILLLIIKSDGNNRFGPPVRL